MLYQSLKSHAYKMGLVCSLAAFLLAGFAPRAAAQVSASISGTVKDPSGAAVAAASVGAKNVETSETRSTVTDDAGRYELLALPVGQYELTVSKGGFRKSVRQGIYLAVGQAANADFALVVGDVQQQVVVTGDISPVNATTVDISGLVGEQQVKDLPLNGRSYDLLMLLDPGVVNFTFEKAGGTGISNSTTANMFSVSGNRPQQNLFLLNGVEFDGAAENNMTPGGASGQMLGIDGVREFNLLQNTYGAEYGKKPGGQVSIVTQSGSNRWHGSLFEFVRNSAMDARNFFDPAGAPAPPFQRNQFGGAVGGPIQKDKTFFFANYEGFRQNLDQTSAALVPDQTSRNDAVQAVKNLLNLWPIAPQGSPDFLVSGNDGVAEIFGTAPDHVREDFGTFRLDHVFSPMDSGNAVYTVDDSYNLAATPADPYSSDVTKLREQVLSLEETHDFSATLLNTARFGFTRAAYYFTGEPTPNTPAATVPGFLAGLPVGAVVVGGSQASNPQAQLGLAGSNNGSNLHIARDLFTGTDDIAVTKGRNQFRFGVWLQPFQSDEEIALSQYGQLTFSGLPALLAGNGATFLYDPSPTLMHWRSVFGALYAEDTIRVTSKLTLSLGFRDEFSTGWNEAKGQAANYTFSSSGVIVCASQPAANDCLPPVKNSLFTVNRAKFLPQPRIGLAWAPFDQKTTIRASFGMFNDLQDALGYRADQNSPVNPVYNIGGSNSVTSFGFPFTPAAAPPANALLVPGGVQPDMYTPTVLSFSFTIERELSPNTSISVAYVGSNGYHELVGADANAPKPVVCPASPCPATFPTTLETNPANSMQMIPVYGALAGKPVPAGTLYTPTSVKPNTALAQTWTWFSEGTSSYNALEININHRFSTGLTFRGVYTYSKALDDGDSLNATAANNAPGLISDPYNPHVDWGLATYDVRNLATANVTYALPVGRGKRFLGGSSSAVDNVVGGWTVNSIIHVQSGFPFTPQLSYNPANNGDSRNPVRPFLNPAFTGKVVTGNPNQWFNPNAFIAFPSNSNFYGNVGRDTFTGPGLATWDFSALKDIRLREGVALQFRAEIFNLLNRANFNTPTLISYVLQPSPNQTLPVVSPTAGLVTSTSTTSRQVQFGLKLLW